MVLVYLMPIFSEVISVVAKERVAMKCCSRMKRVSESHEGQDFGEYGGIFQDGSVFVYEYLSEGESCCFDYSWERNGVLFASCHFTDGYGGGR